MYSAQSVFSGVQGLSSVSANTLPVLPGIDVLSATSDAEAQQLTRSLAIAKAIAQDAAGVGPNRRLSE